MKKLSGVKYGSWHYFPAEKRIEIDITVEQISKLEISKMVFSLEKNGRQLGRGSYSHSELLQLEKLVDEFYTDPSQIGFTTTALNFEITKNILLKCQFLNFQRLSSIANKSNYKKSNRIFEEVYSK